MTFLLTTLPLWLSAVILIVPTTLLATAGPFIVRRYVEVNQLRTNNEVAGFKFATVGVLYAVLLAFAVVVVWQQFKRCDSSMMPAPRLHTSPRLAKARAIRSRSHAPTIGRAAPRTRSARPTTLVRITKGRRATRPPITVSWH